MLEKSRVSWIHWLCILLLSTTVAHAKQSGATSTGEPTSDATVVESVGESALPDTQTGAIATGVAQADSSGADAEATIQDTAPLLSAADSSTVADDDGSGSPDPVAESSDAVAAAAAQYNWATTGYVAWLSEEQLGDMLLFQASLSDQKIWVLALTRRIKTIYKDVDWEVEGQVGKQGGPVDWNWEFNLLTDLRWNRFYWDKYVDTSLAVGLGLSYATEEPQFEIDAHGDTSKILAYILIELALSPPRYPQWAGVVRIHHRSSAYGTFNDNIQGASNALGVGIKYRF